MSESEVIAVATDLVRQSDLAPCSLRQVRFVSRDSMPVPITRGDQWVVEFRFHVEEGIVDSPDIAMVIVDDATGEAFFFECL